MATIDELDSRTRYLENEIEGEKVVTRHVLRQASLNADDLGALKTEVRHLNEQMVLANAALHTQGGRITSLAQDVTMIRQEVTALRRGMEEVHTRLDGMDRRFDAMDRRFDAMDRRFDAMERNIAAILAAVVPQNAPPAGA
jgi:uncharacterized coiled-coil DUF342 family protein